MKNLTIALATLAVVGGVFYTFGPYPPFWVKANIRSSMTQWVPDPDSLQLTGLRYSENGSGIICGQMNAKNRLGAYTGYKKFAHARDRNFTFLEGIGPSADSMIELFHCN
ncbi:hypothetical protein [Mesorhizobium captivum]|uniref:hypothetical protein n=1 Tax=Mesorhizobium captivum TaxID=3072319 RepID=UPI002A24DCDE|nr:hypothetical protein [Mesorhizobium sp. VK22E]MDX8508580.1 hypothetical protein [Mesorhizobium sp. VK22E]